MTQDDGSALIQAQDMLRPVRNFVSLLAGATGDQTYGYPDAFAVNTAGQIPTPQSANGIAVEGKPVIIGTADQRMLASASTAGGIPMWAWLLIGAGVGWMLVKG